MADDKDKPDADADPWASIDAEAAPDLGADFSFSFDDEPSAPTADAESLAMPSFDEPADAPAAEPKAESQPDFEPEPAAGSQPESEPEVMPEFDPEATADAWSVPEAEAEPVAEADDDVASWLDEPDGEPAAPSLSVFQEDEADVEATSDAAESSIEHSAVEIGTGMSGIASASSLGASDEEAEAAQGSSPFGDTDPFAALAAEDDDAPPSGDESEAAEADPWGALETADGGTPGAEAEEDAGMPDFAGLAVAAAAGAAAGEMAEASAAEPAATKPKPKQKRAAPPPAKRKKPTLVGQLLGVVFGGLMAFPITAGILVWGFGKDPFKVTPFVPESMAFLLPEKFRPAPSALDSSLVPNLDDLAAQLPSAEPSTDPAEPADPAPEPVPGDPAPGPGDEPSAPPTDLAVTEPGDAGPSTDDPLMALLNEGTSPAVDPKPEPVVEPEPEPEPLDLSGLERTATAAVEAVDALAAIDDPADPLRKKLEVACYVALAAHAQELAMLERVAADSGRPLASLPDPAAAVEKAVTGRPQLFDPLARLTRFWLTAKKRSSDGVVMPVTLRSAQRLGPYWRSLVTLADAAATPRDIVVISRAEPAVAPGDRAFVTGLVVSDGVVWGSAIGPVASADPFGQ